MSPAPDSASVTQTTLPDGPRANADNIVSFGGHLLCGLRQESDPGRGPGLSESLPTGTQAQHRSGDCEPGLVMTKAWNGGGQRRGVFTAPGR